MATYKFVDADQLDEDLTKVGDAIRSKGETTQLLDFPDEMVSAIEAISTGLELNFDVVAYATEAELLAATPKENTIGIISTVKIQGWALSATVPTMPVNGMVWATLGDDSSIEFNVLKENGLHVCLLSAKQYVDGSWLDVSAMIYQDGEWQSWGLWIIKDGVANGFSNFIRTGYEPEITQGDGFLNILADYSKTAPIATDEKVDLTDCSTIELDVNVLQVADSSNYPNIAGCSVFLISGSSYSSLSAINSAVVASSCATETGRQIIALDVSGIEGEYYIAICIRTDSSTLGEMNVYDLIVR